MNINTKVSLPAEWSFQDAILLCWPHANMDWQPILNEVEPAFDEIAFYICQHQSLVLIAHDAKHQQHILNRLSQSNVNIDNISWLLHSNNDSWCRDFGPITVIEDGSPLALDFTFNGWGNKFPHEFDNKTNQRLKSNQIIHCPLQSVDFVLEGGSIESDGNGTLLTSTQCLLSKQRNSDLDQAAIEHELKNKLGVDRVLWLNNGQLDGDDTDSHIDNLARFCNEDTIVYASCRESDDHFASLNAMKDELEQFKRSDGKEYQLIPLHIPEPLYDQYQRLPASYVNFLITNKFVLMPTYNDPQDNINRDTLQSLFTDRQVIGIDCTSIIKQSGSIHCLTMQLPQHTLYP